MGDMKIVQRLDFNFTDELSGQGEGVAELCIDGKKTGIYGGYERDYQSYTFEDEINVKDYPNILEFNVSDIVNSVYCYIGLNKDDDDFIYWVKLKKLEDKLQISYLMKFDDENKNIKSRALTLWHQVMSELEYIDFTELEDRISFEEGSIRTNAQKTYTNPSLILGDLIKADVKIIDAVIKKVNK